MLAVPARPLLHQPLPLVVVVVVLLLLMPRLAALVAAVNGQTVEPLAQQVKVLLAAMPMSPTTETPVAALVAAGQPLLVRTCNPMHLPKHNRKKQVTGALATHGSTVLPMLAAAAVGRCLQLMDGSRQKALVALEVAETAVKMELPQ
jgi:hypothetical protein